MDLPHPDSSDNQGYSASFEYESGNYTEEHWLREFSLWHERDALHEDALNVKSCMQVLKIWIDKLDEDIVKLEEDMLILQCQQLVWDDEEWSKLCSAALREKIDHLDILLESLKKDDKENGLQSGTEELPPRLHDILKPLLESYLAKSKQTENSIIQMSLPPAVEHTNKKTEENASIVMLKTYERKSKSVELEERKLSLPQQKGAVIKDFPASGNTCTDDDVTAKVISKPNTLEERRMRNVVVVKLEPTDPMANESRANRCMKNGNFRDNEGNRNSDNKAISEAKVDQGRIQHEMKVDLGKQRLESLCTERKARLYRRTSDKNQVLSVKPSVKMKGKNTIIPQTSKGVKDVSSEQVKISKMESENEIQEQQKCEECHQILQNSLPAEHEDKGTPSTENLKQRKDGVSEGSMKGKKETHLQKCKACHQILQNSPPAEHEDKGTPSTENLKQSKDGASEGLSMKGKKKTEQQLSKVPDLTASPISWAREVKISSFSSQTTSKKEAPQSSQLKQVKMEHDVSDSTASTNNIPQSSYPYIKNKEELTLTKLREIAKSRNLRKYSKLKKEDLKKFLGLE